MILVKKVPTRENMAGASGFTLQTYCGLGKVRKVGRMWIRIFPDKSVTARAAETRMGKGKGAVDHWVAVVRPGRILFEMSGVTFEEAKKAFQLASSKLPISTKVVERNII